MIKRIIAKVRREYRKLTAKPYLDNDRYPGFWFREVFGGQPARVVQIGSNDGKTGDPLYELLHANPDWKALLVEPIPYLCERLRENYTDTSRFQVANVAINEGEEMPFYYVDKLAGEELEGLPFWYDQLGSFNRDHITGQLDGVLTPYVREMRLEGVRLPDLLAQYAITAIDILHTDTEGYDWKILSQLDLTLFQPTFILFEANHLSQRERAEVIGFLERDYVVFATGIDGFAVNRGANPVVVQRMQRTLEPFTSTPEK